jgi:tRNA pseudouridine55 synthase
VLESRPVNNPSNMATKRRHGRRIDGVLLLDKPSGISSNAALQRSRRLLEAESAGHTGTLDPMASGLLVLCFGEATKFSGELLDAGKRYVARLRLGVRTATGDAEGEVLERRPVSVTREQVERSLEAFRGEITQIPPMYSALKRDGRPLYEYARRGITLERAPRTVTISALDLENFAGENATISVSCSKGTYVRTLAEDIGEALGCGAHLIGLVRTSVGAFNLDQAHRIEELEGLEASERSGLLLAVDVLVQDLPPVQLPGHLEGAFLHGQAVGPIRCEGQGAGGNSPGRVRVYGTGGRFLGLGLADGNGGVSPKRLLTGP